MARISYIILQNKYGDRVTSKVSTVALTAALSWHCGLRQCQLDERDGPDVQRILELIPGTTSEAGVYRPPCGGSITPLWDSSG